MSIAAIDFFSGCGGTCAGFRSSGIEILLALDNDPEACATFEANFRNAKSLCADIRDVVPTDIQPFVVSGREAGKHLLFSACAPCQPFSIQRRERRRADERYPLLLEFLRFVWYFVQTSYFLKMFPALIPSMVQCVRSRRLWIRCEASATPSRAVS